MLPLGRPAAQRRSKVPTDVSWTLLGFLLAEGEEDGLASPTSVPLAQKDTLRPRMERPPA